MRLNTDDIAQRIDWSVDGPLASSGCGAGYHDSEADSQTDRQTARSTPVCGKCSTLDTSDLNQWL